MLRIYDVQSAKQTLLRRLPPDEMPVPERLLESIAAVFGERLTPAEAVRQILRQVRSEGDAALFRWTQKLDGVALQSLRIPGEELRAAYDALPESQRAALVEAAHRVRRFHERQPLASWVMQELGGTLGQLVRPIRRVGLYVPGGSAPLPSTVLMSAIPAHVAGVEEIAVVTPPNPRLMDGAVPVAPSVLAACYLAGVHEVYALGGAQAIAALAYGTESIPAVDKIFGPGNLFVTLAKQQVFGVVGVDGLAGPTEAMIIADRSARPALVAADLLAQAEHDVMASAILLTPSRELAEAVQVEAARQLEGDAGYAPPGRAEIIAASLENRGGIVLTRDLEEAIALANAYAPEHLALSVSDPWSWVEKVTAAGGVFLGEVSFEVLGDYVAGPSHVMPTSGSARFASPLNVWDCVRLISLVALTPIEAERLSNFAVTLADLEGLDAHARAARLRWE